MALLSLSQSVLEVLLHSVGCLPFSLCSSSSCPPEEVVELAVSGLKDCTADSALFINRGFYLGGEGRDPILVSGLGHVLQSRFLRALNLICYLCA